MWVVACVPLGVFAVDKSRGSAVVKILLGESFGEALVVDRWGDNAWVQRGQ